jgi:hypothetical protein
MGEASSSFIRDRPTTKMATDEGEAGDAFGNTDSEGTLAGDAEAVGVRDRKSVV